MIKDLVLELGQPQLPLKPELREDLETKTISPEGTIPITKSRSRSKGKTRSTIAGKVRSVSGGHKHQVPEGMVFIPKGPFLYGDEKTEISIDHDFFMDSNPVTNEAFAQFIKAGGYETESYWTEEGWQWRKKENIQQPKYWNDKEWNQADHPVVGVSYYEAEAYAKWAGKRLPTEQEWEKAARGTDGRKYPWGEEFDARRCGSSVGESRHRTTPVGSYPEGQSPYGCQDMAGNVWEWCASWSDQKRKYRVLRGGSWYDYNLENFRCAHRYIDIPRIRYVNFGFRCAQVAP